MNNKKLITTQEFEKLLQEVIDDLKQENNIVNKLIRDDVFKILENHCYVVYYPLENENINGFHVVRTIKNESAHFVYINTANTIERRIFAAAHELGHIWQVYQKLQKKCPAIDEYINSLWDGSNEEFVANKFAAQLLMPSDLFREEVTRELGDPKYNYNGKSISTANLLRVIVHLMDTFFVGFKATTRRLFEIGRYTEEVYNIIKTYEDSDIFKNILQEEEYTRLNKRPRHKSISNLTEIIRKAEIDGCELESTIEVLKKDFDINTLDFSESNNEIDF